jgi:hypothetical protein
MTAESHGRALQPVHGSDDAIPTGTAALDRERHDLWKVLDKCQMDLRAASAKLTEVRAMLSQLDLPDPKTVTCPKCGLKRSGPRQLAEHIYTSHDGDLPEHWEAEA